MWTAFVCQLGGYKSFKLKGLSNFRALEGKWRRGGDSPLLSPENQHSRQAGVPARLVIDTRVDTPAETRISRAVEIRVGQGSRNDRQQLDTARVASRPYAASA